MTHPRTRRSESPVTQNVVVGIDPGLTGAIALLGAVPGRPIVTDMPVVDGQVNGAELACILRVMAAPRVVVEEQQAMPKQGVASTFKTGRNYGLILGVLAALEMPVTLVRATEWTRALKVGSDKERHRARAIDWYPTAAPLLARVKDHGRADALLLAHWGVIHHERRAA